MLYNKVLHSFLEMIHDLIAMCDKHRYDAFMMELLPLKRFRRNQLS